ncbi:hypothetical protein [Microvirga roseola]|uniref:hypothetical protein n=1 Tax=Microvirga roseola TaxID=2883126 RepID=UPI001E4FD603|nr:hypothetical protein [Microvirga roseola]
MKMLKAGLYPLACAIFLFVKVVWVLLPTVPMGAPRLGDDALVYLWIGTGGGVLEPKVDTPAIRDIISIRQLQDSKDPSLDYLRARTTMRTTGISSSPLAFINGLFLRAGFSHELAFAASEILVAIALTAGIASFLAIVVGKFAAGIGLMLLTFALLPGQGLQFLVQSVFTLALSLLIWAEISRPKPRILLVILLALTAALTHSIALVYICIAIGYAVLTSTIRARRISIPWTQVFALVSAVVAARILDKVLGGRLPLTTGMGTVTLSDIGENFASAVAYFCEAFWNVPLIWLSGMAGLYIVIKQRKLEVLVALTLSTGAFFAATAFNLEGYPGELSNRLLVPITIILAGLAGLCIRVLLESSLALRATALSLVAAHLVINAHATQLAFFDNLNGRNYIYDPVAVRTDLNSLPASASIIWTDPDVTMMAAFLEGAWRFRAIPYPMIEGSPHIDRILSEWKPDHIAAPVPRVLNTSSEIPSRSLSPRVHGIDFSDFQAASISFEEPVPSSIYLRLSAPTTANKVSFALSGQSGPCTTPQRKNISINNQRWVKLDLTKCPIPKSLTIKAKDQTLALLGVRLAAPSGQVNWPWGSPLVLRGTPHNSDRDDILVRFDWASLLGASLTAHIMAPNATTVLSDTSGIVWLKVETVLEKDVSPANSSR